MGGKVDYSKLDAMCGTTWIKITSSCNYHWCKIKGPHTIHVCETCKIEQKQ